MNTIEKATAMNQPKIQKVESASRCCAQVRVSGLQWPTFRQCHHKGAVISGGKHYCKMHSPEAVKARQTVRLDKYRKENAQQEYRFNCLRACKGMVNPEAEVAALCAVAEAAKSIFGEHDDCRCDVCKFIKPALSALSTLRAKEGGK